MRSSLVAFLLTAACVACGRNDADAPELTAPPGETTAADGVGTNTQDLTPDGNCGDATKTGGQADLEMREFAFLPPCLQIATDQGLHVHNEGKVEHNWSVEGYGLDIDLAPGDENNTEATGLEPGTYTFFCKYHRESNGMSGELRIKNDK